jgi:hypothetical protein
VTGGTALREPTHKVRTGESAIGKETTMLHPFTTEELVGQRRAALNAEASHARLAGQLRPQARGDLESARFVLAARILVRQVRAVVARAT